MTAPSSPQVEDGFTRLANELLEALLRAGLTSRQWAVVMAVARKTYGFNKKEDDIGLSQLVELTGLAKPHLSVAIKSLEERGIITRRPGKFAHSLGINKMYRSWDKATEGVTELVTVTDSVTVTESVTQGYRIGNERVTELVTTKETSKDSQKKEPRAKRSEINFDQWMEQCHVEGRKPIPEDDAVFDYAESVGLDVDHIRMAWMEFKRKYTGNKKKKYISWNRTFQNCVRENWYGLWFDRDGAWLLTTRGKQLETELNARKQYA